MRIHCDHCGAEIEKTNAVVQQIEEEVIYFCSQECLAKSGRVSPLQYPEPDDTGEGPMTEADPGEPEE